MQITETSADGLNREFKVVVSAQDIERKMNERLQEMSRTTRLPGFRPGKVPATLLKQRFGQAVMGEVLEQAVADSSQKAVTERGLRPAVQPKIEVTQFEEGKDLEYSMSLEVLPDIEPSDFSSIELEKPVAEVSDEQVEEAIQRVAESRRDFEAAPEGHAAATGDAVVVDFDGSVDGERKPGMKAEDHELVLGSGSFVDTFEEQLTGAKVGEHRTVTVTFPETYGAADLAGKEAVFEVDVKEVKTAKSVTIDDEFAKSLGVGDLEELRKMVRERIGQDYAQLSRARVKRALLDALAETYSFDVPQSLLDAEFDGIWKRLQQEIEGGRAPDEAAKDEEELKAEYRTIAERRVRLGLLLAEVGRRNNVQVTPDELNRAMFTEAQRYPGQERQVFEFLRGNRQMVENLRAPLFEDKVVDHILEQAKVSEHTVSVEELMRDPDETTEDAA